MSDRPKLTIASMNDESAIARHHERDAQEQHFRRVEMITKDLAANMLAVTRGGGDVKDLPGQVEALWRAIEQSPDEVAYENVADAMRVALKNVPEGREP